MITHARWGCWETNSSTMNQIAISQGMIIRNDELPRHVLLNYDFPQELGNMVTDTIHKIRVAWALIQEVRFEMRDASKRDLMQSAKNYCPDALEGILFMTLKQRGIDYDIDPSVDMSEDPGIGLIGLCGVRDDVRELFTAEGRLEKFLFDNRSMFTFGFENAWPHGDRLGYTDIPSTGYDILEV